MIFWRDRNEWLAVAANYYPGDGKLVAAGGSGGHGTSVGTIYLWQVHTGKELRQIRLDKGVILMPLCFSPDGRMLAAWQGDDVRKSVFCQNRLVLLEVATGRERASTPEGGNVISAAAFSPDGLTISQACWDRSIHVWEILMARPRHRFQSDQRRIEALSFSADGTRLASAGANATALVWDMSAGPPRQPNRERELSAKATELFWGELAAADASRTFKAMKELYATPKQTVRFFRSHLRPIAAVDAQRVQRLLAGLDADDFVVREKATRELEALGEAVEPSLRQAMQGAPSPELGRRVKGLLDKLAASPERLRTLRALEVLEWLNTSESRKVLDSLAHGAPGVWLTNEAKASLARHAP
jgi:hypothetical protein